MTIYEKFERSFNYARRNGYKNSLRTYVKGLHSSYRQNCLRVGIRPMNYVQWEAVQLGN